MINFQCSDVRVKILLVYQQYQFSIAGSFIPDRGLGTREYRASHSVRNTRLQHPHTKFNMYLLSYINLSEQLHLAALSTMDSLIIEWSSAHISDLDLVDYHQSGTFSPERLPLAQQRVFVYRMSHDHYYFSTQSVVNKVHPWIFRPCPIGNWLVSMSSVAIQHSWAFILCFRCQTVTVKHSQDGLKPSVMCDLVQS